MAPTTESVFQTSWKIIWSCTLLVHNRGPFLTFPSQGYQQQLATTLTRSRITWTCGLRRQKSTSRSFSLSFVRYNKLCIRRAHSPPRCVWAAGYIKVARQRRQRWTTRAPVRWKAAAAGATSKIVDVLLAPGGQPNEIEWFIHVYTRREFAKPWWASIPFFCHSIIIRLCYSEKFDRSDDDVETARRWWSRDPVWVRCVFSSVRTVALREIDLGG